MDASVPSESSKVKQNSLGSKRPYGSEMTNPFANQFHKVGVLLVRIQKVMSHDWIVRKYAWTQIAT